MLGVSMLWVAMLFMPTDALAERIAGSVAVVLLAFVLFRGLYIVLCVWNGKRLPQEDAAARRRRERGERIVYAFAFGVLLLLALWKYVARFCA